MELISNLIQIAAIVGIGILGGELIGKIKLPKVLGYIFVGLFIGPYALGFLDIDLVQTSIFGLILAIGIGFVGLSVGAGISFEEIKEGGTKILIVGLFASFTPFVLVSLAMYHLLDFDLYSSLIIGSIALATSPITALSIINEYKVEGPIKNTLLLLAAIDDAIAIVLFGVILAYADSYYNGSGEASILEPFVEIGISVVVGLAVGYLIYIAIKLLAERTTNKIVILVVTIFFVLLMIFIANYIHAEALLTGITAGVIIYNLLEGKPRKLFDEATKKTIGLSVVLALVLVGAMLDISSIFSWFAITGAIVYILTRAIGCISGASIGSKIAKMEKNVQKYLGFTLLSGAGVALTFAGVAITVIPDDYGVKLGAMIAAAAVINEVLAVFTTKWAFTKADEIGKA